MRYGFEASGIELVIVRVLFLGVATLTESLICDKVAVATRRRAVASLRRCHGERSRMRDSGDCIVDATSRSHQGLPGGPRSPRRLQGESGNLAKCVVC